MKQCQLCEVRTRKKLKHYVNNTKRAGHPIDLMLCGSCFLWYSKKLKANHGGFVK